MLSRKSRLAAPSVTSSRASCRCASPTAAASPVPAPAGVSFGPIAFATAINDDREAVDPTDVFQSPVSKVYAVFPYRGMRNGLPFTAIWYYQGREIIRDEYEWSWGTTDRSYLFINPVGPGQYTLELKVGASTVATATFRITP